MTVLEQLLEYQKVDAELRKIEQSVAGSEERKKFSQAKKIHGIRARKTRGAG